MGFSLFGIILGAALGWSAEPVDITLLHTNDLHSHFRAEKDPLGLGGVARLKTLIDRARKESPRTLLVDGGDWSEGDIYFREGAGTETLRMMDRLTYDVAVVGNHDWLNGPDALLSIIERSSPRFSMIAANIDASDYARRDDFARLIPPYVIRELGGVRVAFIGLVTYELVYDRFFEPVDINQPFTVTRELSKRLRKEADLVVVVSHNSLKVNEAVLKAAPEVDIVIGAHDHEKTITPRIVKRRGGNNGYLVEAGSWGRYLGRLDLRVQPRTTALSDTAASNKPRFEVRGFRLLQVDSSIPEDPETLAQVERLESLLETRYGPIFHDHVATNHAEILRDGPESLLGNFATDAYRAATGADFALDQVAMIYGELHRGQLTSADLYNANPGVYDPVSDRSWTLKRIPIRGRTLSWLLRLLFSSRKLAELGILSASGLELTYDPLLQQQKLNKLPDPLDRLLGLSMPGNDPDDGIDADSVIQDVRIGGRPLETGETYSLAASGGMVLVIQAINSIIPGAIPLDKMVDTGVETWRVMADYARALSPIEADKIPVGNRIRSQQPDLSVLGEDISWQALALEGDQLRVRVRVKTRNLGRLPSTGTLVRIMGNLNKTDTTREPQWIQAGDAQSVAALASGGEQVSEWEVLLPGERGLFPIRASVDALKGEANRANNGAERWIVYPLQVTGAPASPCGGCFGAGAGRGPSSFAQALGRTSRMSSARSPATE